MALKENLQQALNANYDLLYFRQNILEPVFGANLIIHSVAKPMAVNPSEESSVKWIKNYGEIKLKDYRTLDLYEVALSDNVIVERNKVSIGAVVKKLIAGNNAVLVNFYYPNQKNKSWRLSFLAKEQIIEVDEIKKTATNPKRYTYILGHNETCRTAAERFSKLSLEPEFTVDALKDAFSVEKLSKAFFDEYKVHYERFVEHLNKRNFKSTVFNGDETAIRTFAKKLLGRIVFLYFVQKKGWLGASDDKWQDGNQNFIQNLFIASGKNEDFYHLWLRKLFYDSLNNSERINNAFVLPDNSTVKIPFLNGGLFEDDDPKGILTFPKKIFEDLFEFFNQYNFTIYEDSPDEHTIAVDPEMLGHIFENLLEDNKDKGAYYTPKEIVHFMCQESLIEYLTTQLSKEYTIYKTLGADQIELFGSDSQTKQLKMLEQLGDKALNREDVECIVKQKDISKLTKTQLLRIAQLLDSVKICDPAIGSGAFPMGLLQEIFSIKELIAYSTKAEWKPAEAKLNIIQNSIYGVDIEKGAVDIARLRFWLSLIVDEENPKPLPNLDYKIVVGNSLLSKFEDNIIDVDWDYQGTDSTKKIAEELNKALNKLVKKQKQFFSDRKTNKDELKNEIKDLKITILENQVLLNQAKYHNKNKQNQIKLFEKNKRDKDDDLIIQNFGLLLIKLKAIKNTPNKPFVHFDWKLDFPEIMNPAIAGENCGFDIVIANPPYIKEYTNRNAFDGIRSSPYYQGKMDIWYFFACQCLDFLKENSVLTFIATNNWVTNSGASIMRNKVISDSRILKMIDFGSYMIFGNASIQTMIMMFKRDASIDNYSFDFRKLLGNTCNLIDVINFLNKEPNIEKTKYLNPEINKPDLKNKFLVFGETSEEELLLKIQKMRNFTLDERLEVAQGIVTPQDSLNKAGTELLNFSIPKGTGIFVLNTNEKKSLNFSDSEKKLIKPLFTTDQLGKYCANSNNKLWIIYTDSKFKYSNEIKPYPNIKSHLDRFSQIITSDNHPYGLHRARVENFFTGEKIISVRKCAEPTFTYTDFNCYVLQTFYVIKTSRVNQKFLTGLLNSKLIAFWLKHKGKMQGGQYQVDKEPLLEIPICSPVNPQIIIDKVEKIIENKSNQAETTLMENDIDFMVYKLYKLSYDEVLIVDKEFEKEMSMEEYEGKDFGFEYEQPEETEVISKPVINNARSKAAIDRLKDFKF